VREPDAAACDRRDAWPGTRAEQAGRAGADACSRAARPHTLRGQQHLGLDLLEAIKSLVLFSKIETESIFYIIMIGS
jgi:hypothetical protein